METSDKRLLAYEDLRAITGYERYGDIMRCLRKQGIAVFFGKGGAPWTTVDLINYAGGLRTESASAAPYPVDDFR